VETSALCSVILLVGVTRSKSGDTHVIAALPVKQKNSEKQLETARQTLISLPMSRQIERLSTVNLCGPPMNSLEQGPKLLEKESKGQTKRAFSVNRRIVRGRSTMHRFRTFRPRSGCLVQ